MSTDISEDRCALYASMAMPTKGTDTRATVGADAVVVVVVAAAAVFKCSGVRPISILLLRCMFAPLRLLFLKDVLLLLLLLLPRVLPELLSLPPPSPTVTFFVSFMY